MPTLGLLLLAANVIAVLACAQLIANRPLNILDPAWAILIGYSIDYIVRPAMMYLGGTWGLAYAGYYRSEVLVQNFDGAVLLGMLFLTAFAVGNVPAYRLRTTAARVLLPNPSVRGGLYRLRYPIMAAALVATGCLAMYLRIQSLGGAPSWGALLTGGTRAEQLSSPLGNGIYLVTIELAEFGWVMICFRWAELRLRRRLSRREGVMFALIGIASLLLFLVQGSRISLASVVFAPLGCYFALATVRRQVSPTGPRIQWGRLLRTAALIMLIAGPLGLFLKKGRLSLENSVNLGISAWDAFEPTAVGMHYLNPRAYLYGLTYVQDIVYTYLPRTLFPSKPDRYGILLAQDAIWPSLSTTPGTYPPGMAMEGYCNGGLLGVIIAGLVVGFFCRMVYEKLAAGSWFWICTMTIYFPQFASFRAFGNMIPGLYLLCGGLFGALALVCRVGSGGRVLSARTAETHA